MSRLLPIARDALPENQRRFYDAVRAIRRRPISGPFIVTMNSSPDLAARLIVRGNAGADSTAETRHLPPLLKAPSRAARWGCGPRCRHDSGDRVWRALARLTPDQKILVDFCYPLLRGNHHVGDIAYEAAVRQFGVPAAVQIAGMLGYVLVLGWIANAFEISISDDDSIPAL